MKLAEYLKGYAALIGAILTALSATTGVIPDGAKLYVSIALAVVTGIATWRLPNQPAADA